ncbi:hypothetical protein ACWD5Q_02950 [Streptomyces sp. NPDC002513]
MSTERPDDTNGAPDVSEGTGAAVPRRRSPVVVASVAAAVLLVGGGGAFLATNTSGGPGGSRAPGGSPAPGGDGTPPALALDGVGVGVGVGEGTAPGIAVGEPNPYGTTYTVRGTLPGGPGSAPVYWAKGRVTQDEVARLARALELSGTPRLVGDTWQVGAVKDGAEPSLRVTRDAPGTWTFDSFVPGTDNCPRGTTLCRPAGSSTAGVRPGPVSEEAARRAAAPVLKAVGQDDAKLDASQLMDRVRVVNAEPVVGGLPTHGWTTGLRISAEGKVIGGSGRLAAPVKGAVYPVLGARRTLDLMNGAPAYGRKGIGGCTGPVPVKDRDEKPCRAGASAPQRASASVEGAVFGLAAHAVGGQAVLVPSWLFEVRETGTPQGGDGFTVAYPAVAPRYLVAPQPPGRPSGTPAPRPSPSTSGPGNQAEPAPAHREVKVLGYTADGRDLTLAYEGGVCADYAASVREDADRVTVTVTETPWQGKVCAMIAKIYHETVRLKAPLGDRRVVGSDGRPIPPGTADTPPTASSGGAGSALPR